MNNCKGYSDQSPYASQNYLVRVLYYGIKNGVSSLQGVKKFLIFFNRSFFFIYHPVKSNSCIIVGSIGNTAQNSIKITWQMISNIQKNVRFLRIVRAEVEKIFICKNLLTLLPLYMQISSILNNKCLIIKITEIL